MKKRIISTLLIGTLTMGLITGCSFSAGSGAGVTSGKEPTPMVASKDKEYQTGAILDTLPELEPDTDITDDLDTNTDLGTDLDTDLTSGSDIIDQGDTDVTASTGSGGYTLNTSDAFSDVKAASCYISDEALEMIQKVDSDYSKVKWAVQYTLPDMEGLIISITPCFSADGESVVVAVTNLYSEDVGIWASGYIKGMDGSSVGSVYINNYCLGRADTTAVVVPVSADTDGSIHWDFFEKETAIGEGPYWESDWALGKSDAGDYAMKYKIISDDSMDLGTVTALVLNQDGYVIGYGTDDNTNHGKEVEGVVDFGCKEFGGSAADIALFVNPVKY
jgi:hypothetical protein